MILHEEMDIGNVCVLLRTYYTHTHTGLVYTYWETNLAASTVSGLQKSEFFISVELNK